MSAVPPSWRVDDSHDLSTFLPPSLFSLQNSICLSFRPPFSSVSHARLSTPPSPLFFFDTSVRERACFLSPFPVDEAVKLWLINRVLKIFGATCRLDRKMFFFSIFLYLFFGDTFCGSPMESGKCFSLFLALLLNCLAAPPFPCRRLSIENLLPAGSRMEGRSSQQNFPSLQKLWKGEKETNINSMLERRHLSPPENVLPHSQIRSRIMAMYSTQHLRRRKRFAVIANRGYKKVLALQRRRMKRIDLGFSPSLLITLRWRIILSFSFLYLFLRKAISNQIFLFIFFPEGVIRKSGRDLPAKIYEI